MARRAARPRRADRDRERRAIDAIEREHEPARALRPRRRARRHSAASSPAAAAPIASAVAIGSAKRRRVQRSGGGGSGESGSRAQAQRLVEPRRQPGAEAQHQRRPGHGIEIADAAQAEPGQRRHQSPAPGAAPPPAAPPAPRARRPRARPPPRAPPWRATPQAAPALPAMAARAAMPSLRRAAPPPLPPAPPRRRGNGRSRSRRARCRRDRTAPSTGCNARTLRQARERGRIGREIGRRRRPDRAAARGHRPADMPGAMPSAAACRRRRR